jgi:4-amino-4-deoxy-L-arabinose transferase-like glycosyltransferase
VSLGRGPWLKLFGLTGLAAAQRFYQLGAWSLWIDEGNTLYLTQHLSGKRPTDAYPLFFWLERMMVDALGTSEFALRLLPALLGILSVPLLYLLFRRVAGERAAGWAALLMALSPWHLFWSQNARYYTLLLVIALLLYRLVWDWWEEGGRARLAGIALLGGIGMLSQYTLILAWPALAAYPLLARWLLGARQDARFAWRRVWIFWGALAVPLAFALGRLLSFSEGFAGIPRHYGDNPLVLLAGLGFHLGLPLCLAILAGLWTGRRLRDRVRRRFALFLAAGAVLPALFAALATVKVIATSYYVFFALPFFLLLAGIALAESRETRRLNLLAGLLLVAASVHELALYYTVQHGDRIRWREAVEYVQRHRAPADRIIGAGSEAVSYYLGEEPARLNGTDRQTMIQWELKPEWRQPTARTWYVVNDQLIAELDRDGAFRRFLAEECRLRKELPLWSGPKNRTARVYLWEPKAEPIGAGEPALP